MQAEYNVLDKGFVKLVAHMGNDHHIAQAARTSYAAGTKSISDDRNLVRYLMRNRHTSPFEMAEIQLHVKCPLFVQRQWIRHRTANVNEVSGRYSILNEEFYIPEPERIQAQSKDNKQGSSDNLSEDVQKAVISLVKDMANKATLAYQTLLRHDVARELSRIVLPLNLYTEFIWKIDLHNLFNFLRLRLDEHAQWEIRQYAEVIAQIVQELFPESYRAFEDYVVNAITFSRMEVEILSAILSDVEEIEFSGESLSKTEKIEFKKKLERMLNARQRSDSQS